MKIGIVDVDLLDKRRQHRFPNLACMKLSNYNKFLGYNVELVLSYDWIDDYSFFPRGYDKIFASKVFTDTEHPPWLTKINNLEYGGTGFFFDKAPPLPDEIEHHMPDYHLYDKWVEVMLKSGCKEVHLKYYQNFSIGFTTRGCVRGCSFCVNKNKKKINAHSPVSEFLNNSKKFISLWDDNILGFPKWRDVFEELNKIGKPFEYKQGMDLRFMTEDKVDVIKGSNYYGDYIFAFDNIKDKDMIIDKLDNIWLKKINPSAKNKTKFFILVGFDEEGKYDEAFWKKDMYDAFERVKILMDRGCYPYIMRYEECKKSDYKWFYITLATWCNQINIFVTKNFEYVYRERCKKTPLFDVMMKEERFAKYAKMKFNKNNSVNTNKEKQDERTRN